MKTTVDPMKRHRDRRQPKKHLAPPKLGLVLRRIRSEIVASGAELLDWDQLDRELAQRRGESNGEPRA